MGCSKKAQFTNFAAGLDFTVVYTEYCKIMDFVVKGNSKSHLNALTWLNNYLNPDGSRNIERCTTFESNGIPDPSNPVIPFTLDAAWTKHGHDRKAKDELVGCLLYIAGEMFQRGAHKQNTNTNEPIQQATSTQIYLAARNQAQWIVPDEYRTDGAWRKDRVLPPGLRPECVQDYGEHICERWNRIWHCLRMVDYYKPASKGQLMWVAGPEKDFDKPKRWQPQTISTEPAAELDEEDPTLGSQEELAPSKKTKVVRQLECTWILASGQDGLYDHLRHSSHREYAQRLQTEHIVISPCEFRDVNQWNSCLGRLLKFKELEVDVMKVTMLLLDENGLNSFEECSIFDDDTVWRDYEVDETFEAAHAKKAVFSFTLEPGQPPSTVRFVMPLGLERHWEESRTIVEQLAPTDTQPRAPEIIVAAEEAPASTTLAPSSPESLSDTIQWYPVHLRS